MNKQQKIRQACIKNDHSVFGRYLHIGDILSVLLNRKEGAYLFQSTEGMFAWSDIDDEPTRFNYNLSIPFTEQKEEVYDFIISILDK